MVALDLKQTLAVDSTLEVLVEELASSDAGLSWQGDAIAAGDALYCETCARDARYASVFRGGRTYCSVACAESVAGLYLG